MSTNVLTQTGQVPPDERDGSATPPAGTRQEPQSLIQESIKYRRRAQEAERQAEALETELQQLRQAESERAAGLETDLAQARTEAEALRERVEAIERDRRLERELARAGCGDIEAGLAVAHERLAGEAPPEDLAALARSLVAEKPHLRGAASGAALPGAAAGNLPPPSAGVKPDADTGVRRAAQRLAERARETGNPTDVMAYMRARRARAG
jgi:hypothetical protein